MIKNKLIKYVLLTGTVVLLLFAAFSCHSPTEPNNSLSLTLEDVSCTEAWLKVTGETGSEVILNRDDKEVQKFTLNSSPQTIFDDSLLPNKTYTYQAILNNRTSSKVTAQTLDTTSSNFTWEVDTIGAQGSILYDIDVINDTLAYAVGSIYFANSTGHSDLSHPYNFMKWNGKSWKYYTLKYFPPGSAGDSAYGPGTAVFANNSSDIWVSAFVPFHFNGLRWSAYYNTGANQANKIWESPDDKQLYFVGNNGMIAYSPDQGSSWEQVQTGTTLPFQDIWGNGGQVLAVASSHQFPDRQLFTLQANKATAISDSGLYYQFGGVWFVPNRKYFVVGDGVFTKSTLGESAWYRHPLGEIASDYSDAIRGTGFNDIVIAGDLGDVSHFNGIRWTEYKSLHNQIDQLVSVSIKGNIIIAAGERTYNGLQYYGLVYVGRR